jgi:aminocarboxymuconate-semialdehyde decarboxylase
MIIDCHSHIADPAIFDRVGAKIPRVLLDVDNLLAEQERASVDLSVISGPRVMETGIEKAGMDPVEIARGYNDFAANLVARHPKRLAALGIAHPFGDDRTLREMERAVRELGLRGFLVIPRYGEDFIDSPKALPFFEQCEKLGAIVFVHSADSCIACEHMQENRLVELVGRPNEMALIGARLILRGHLERFPQLKLLLARLGGAITMYAGRIENGWQTRHSRTDGIPPWGPDNLHHSFMASLRKIFVDTQTFHPPAIRCAVETIGDTQVLLGTDFPPVPRPVADSVEDVRRSGLSPDSVDRILGGNALNLFGLRMQHN